LDEAADALQRCSELLEAEADRAMLPDVLINKTELLTRRGQITGAIECGERAVRIAQEMADEYRLASAHFALASALTRQESFQAAQKSLEASAERYRLFEDDQGIANVIAEWGAHEEFREDYVGATTHYADALHRATRGRYHDITVYCLIGLAHSAFAQSQLANAWSWATEASSLALGARQWWRLETSLRLLQAIAQEASLRELHRELSEHVRQVRNFIQPANHARIRSSIGVKILARTAQSEDPPVGREWTVAQLIDRVGQLLHRLADRGPLQP
jgi:tetratricopeptide (TPR) repeat protein